MVKSPQRIWIEADEECPYFYEAHELHDVEQDVIEYVRADLYAALEAKLADLAVKAKPLVWEYHPAGLVASAGGIGEAYIIDTRIARHVYFLKGMDHNMAFPSVEAAKAAAQADFERRILSALEARYERA